MKKSDTTKAQTPF